MIPDTLIVHCSMSPYGDVFLIDEWHRARRFRRIGYHAVILNGYPHKSNQFFEVLDGQIQPGRKVWSTGAHCLNGYNSHSWGICLIGGYKQRMFSEKQLEALKRYYENMDRFLEMTYRKRLHVIGHYEGQPNKTCPDIQMTVLREFLSGDIGAKEMIQKTQYEWDNR